MEGERKGADIAERLLRYAANVIWICKNLLSTPEGRHIRKQLVGSGTSPGANYEEARCAESRADFVHKLKIANKELRESRYWLRLAKLAGFLPHRAATSLIAEASELVAILTASIKTARRAMSNTRDNNRIR